MILSELFFWVVPCIALGLFVLLLLFFCLSHKDRLTNVFIVLLAASTIWTACSLLMKLEIAPSALFWSRVMIGGYLLNGLMYYFFISSFTGTLSKRPVIFWSVLVAGVSMVNLLGLAVTDLTVEHMPVLVDGQEFVQTSLVYSLSPWMSGLYAVIGLLLASTTVKAVRAIRSGHPRSSSILLFVIGMGLMYLGVGFNAFSQLGRYPIDVLMGFINAILMMVAVYKYRMQDFRFVFTRGLIYFLVALLVSCCYVAVVIGVLEFVLREYPQYTMLTAALTALVLAVLLLPVFRLSSYMTNRLFHRSHYYQRQLLRDFSGKIANKLNLEEITLDLIGSVQSALQAENVYLALRDEDRGLFIAQRGAHPAAKTGFEFNAGSPIADWLNEHEYLTNRQLTVQATFKGLWEQELMMFKQLGVELMIPLKSRGVLIGILLITQKHGGGFFSQEDIDLLIALSGSAAVAVDNARIYDRAQDEADTDSLTTLFNHRYFLKELRRQIILATEAPLSLVLIDLDMFKLFNDMYGHFEGDQALQQVASIIRGKVGQRGTVARYSGEEFGVILPGYDSRQALALTEQIRQELQQRFYYATGKDHRFLTCSAGVCTYPQAATGVEDLLQRADMALYHAKSTGKNRVEVYTPKVATLRGQDIANKRIQFMSNPQPPPTEPSQDLYATTLFALTAAIETKDFYTYGHSQNVAEYSTALAAAIGLDDAHVRLIMEAALLHDIGKIGIPEDILRKTERLTPTEFDIMRQHVNMSVTIIRHLPSMQHVIPAVTGHHERWDGTGYPRGIKYEEIPISARCLGVADAFDAITSTRSYRTACTLEYALEELHTKGGTQFDPHLAQTFIKLVENGDIIVHGGRVQLPPVV